MPTDGLNNDQSSEVTATAHLLVSITMIAISLALGLFLIWIVNIGWVLEIFAGVFLLLTVVLGIVVGRYVYKFLVKTLPRWTSMTAAIILGIAVAVAFGELTHSHELIRDYEHFSSDYDDDR